jgi:hypothetical protein
MLLVVTSVTVRRALLLLVVVIVLIHVAPAPSIGVSIAIVSSLAPRIGAAVTRHIASLSSLAATLLVVRAAPSVRRQLLAQPLLDILPQFASRQPCTEARMNRRWGREGARPAQPERAYL